MEDMDYYEWEESKKRFTPAKIIKFIFKLIATLIIVTTFTLLIGRMLLMRIPRAFTGVSATQGIVATVNGGTFDAVMQEPLESFSDNGKDENGKLQRGWYHVSNVALSESAGEVQLTVRYNSRSTVNTLMEKYALTERPTGEVFVYILSDDKGNVYTDYVFAAKSRLLYEFRRVVFTGVDLTEVETLYLDVFWREDVSKDGLMSASIEIYESTYGVEIPESDELSGKNLTFIEASSYDSSLENNK